MYFSATKSGKLNSDLFQEWLTKVLVPKTGSKSLLILDSWGGHVSEDPEDLVPLSKKFSVKTIPEGTTGFTQPLDVFGFRVWKNFVRTFSDLVLLMDIDINLHLRNNIIKLQSLTHNQFSSPRYREMFKYSWYKSGYLKEEPGKFENPVDFCFGKKEKEIPSCENCADFSNSIIRCSWCKTYFCFDHFFKTYHYCENFVA